MASRHLDIARPKRVAIFRVGHLGDTIISMPALWTVRKCFPDATIFLLAQRKDPTKIQALDVLRKGTVYDQELIYGTESKFEIFKGLLTLRAARVDTLVYIPPVRTNAQLDRDKQFFKLAGIKHIIGMKDYYNVERPPAGVPLPRVAREADILLTHLAADGVATDLDPKDLVHLGLSDAERSDAVKWLAARGVKPGERIVGVGPGSKMPSKLWSPDRFREVLEQVNQAFAPTFISFGSSQERDVCESVLPKGAKTINAAGEISVRGAAAVLEHIKVHLGNDTGTMHLAAASGARCVALFSARDWPNRWYPYGDGHAVFRSYVPCEGCLLEVCTRNNLCLDLIETQPVAEAMLKICGESFI